MSTGRDYRKLTTPRNRGSLSGGAGLVIGLALGGVLAFFTYQQGKKAGTAASVETRARKPAPQQAAEAAADAPPVDTINYTFYDRLPEQGVDVPKKQETLPSVVPAEEDHALYLVQVVSLQQQPDAEAVRAELALKGYDAKLQTVEVAGETWHRVIIGPLNEMNVAQATADQLAKQKYNPVVSRVAD